METKFQNKQKFIKKTKSSVASIEQIQQSKIYLQAIFILTIQKQTFDDLYKFSTLLNVISLQS